MAPKLSKLPPTGVYNIKNVKSHKAFLNIAGGRTKRGTPIQLWDNPGHNDSKFRIERIGGDLYTIRNVNSETAFLNVAGGKAKRGTPIQLWDDPESKNTQWTFRVVETPKEFGGMEAYNICSAKNSLTCLHVNGPESKNSVRINLWDDAGQAGHPCSMWTLKLIDEAHHLKLTAKPTREAAALAVNSSLPTPEVLGTQQEPLFVFRNVHKEKPEERGQIVAQHLIRSFRENNVRLPQPTGNTRWASYTPPRTPVSGRALVQTAQQILKYLRANHGGDKHINSEPNRGFYCGNVNVTSRGGGQGWHQDAEAYGSLVIIFAAGNDSQSEFKFGGWNGKDTKKVTVHSGDAIVFEGQTCHTVKECTPGTSPFKNDKSHWLHDRRLSVLIRQDNPKRGPTRPGYLKKK